MKRCSSEGAQWRDSGPGWLVNTAGVHSFWSPARGDSYFAIGPEYTDDPPKLPRDQTHRNGHFVKDQNALEMTRNIGERFADVDSPTSLGSPLAAVRPIMRQSFSTRL